MNVNFDDFQPVTGELPASVRMIGTGGAGISGIARTLLARGIRATGSDVKESCTAVGLRAMGATTAINHNRTNLELTSEGELPEAVVISFAAIPKTNPELAGAYGLGILVFKHSGVLVLLMRDSKALPIVGAHGKTSTTLITVAALQTAGLDPSLAAGGLVNKAGVNVHQGSDDVFVTEVDESDASLLTYQLEAAVIISIEPDHLGFFGNGGTYYAVFDALAERTKGGGHLVACVEDPHAAALGKYAAKRGINVLAYDRGDALTKHPTLPVGTVLHGRTPVGGGAHMEAIANSTSMRFELHQPSRHMALNALAAVVDDDCVGADLERVARGLGEFTGVCRRFDYHGSISEELFVDARICDDHVHHPTEVSTVLSAARELVTETGRDDVIATSQPRPYSCTRNFADEFAVASSLAGRTVLFDIFGVREEPLPGVDGTLIANKMTIPVTYEPHFTSIPAHVREVAEPYDIILTVGAGSMMILADEIIRELSGDNDGQVES